MDEAGVDRVVIVPPSWPGDRNDYGLEAARRYPDRFAVMGRIPLENPESAKLLPNWKQQPGMLGVRVTFMREQAALLTGGTADWLWPAAEKAGLPIMFLAPGNIPKFAPIAERHPGLPLIIDHMSLMQETAKEGKIPRGHRRRGCAREISQCLGQAVVGADLFVRALSLARHDRAHQALLRRLRAAALLLGNRPHQRVRQITYRQRITHFTEELPFLSEEDKDWVMGRAILQRLGWK